MTTQSETKTGNSVIDNRAASVAAQFRSRVSKSGHREAFRWPSGGGWASATWAQAGETVDLLAAGLLSLGLTEGQRVGILASTRYEWITADLAVMCAGGATTTVYPSTNAEDVAFILSDSGCVIVFAENDEQLAKLREHRDQLADIKKVVTFDGAADGDWVISLDDLQEAGRKLLAGSPEAVTAAIDALAPGDLATLIYTSGTTGKPKGVRLTHSAWTYEGAALESMGFIQEDDLQFLWLPLAHSFGKVLLTAQLATGFATAVDGRVDKIIENVGELKPTFMGAAPRIFEKAHAKVVTTSASAGGIKFKLFERAFAVGKEIDRRNAVGQPVPPHLKLQHALLDKLVLSKVRDIFGGRIRFFISGAAPLNRDIGEWFHAAGIKILEGYGLTETAAGAVVNRPDDYRLGTVGKPLPGVQIKLGESNEVLIKGPNVMEGYHNLPEATAEAIDSDGWFRTGDQGSIDPDGFLSITGRTKDLFKTSGGKYIAPSAIEASFKAICPYVSQFQVFGHAEKYCVALISLDPEGIVGWAAENGLEGASYQEIAASPQAKAMIGGYVDEMNAKLNRWETIKKWAILDHDLTIESGELTPSLKVKRNVVEEHHRAILDELFAG
jgi:long-chain acyl-CoA synthetase